jgi:hypothetical protein
MRTTDRTIREDRQLGVRFLMGLCVAAVTYFAWGVLWVIGSAALGLASLFGPHHSVTRAERFGGVWQWVVAGFAIALICTLLGAPRYSRLMGIGWFLAIAVLAVNGILLPGRFEPTLGPLFPVIIAAGLLVWTHRAAQRAA